MIGEARHHGACIYGDIGVPRTALQQHLLQVRPMDHRIGRAPASLRNDAEGKAGQLQTIAGAADAQIFRRGRHLHHMVEQAQLVQHAGGVGGEL